MFKAAVLLSGVATYFWFLSLGQSIAQNEMRRLQNLYTSANVQADDIAAQTR